MICRGVDGVQRMVTNMLIEHTEGGARHRDPATDEMVTTFQFSGNEVSIEFDGNPDWVTVWEDESFNVLSPDDNLMPGSQW